LLKKKDINGDITWPKETWGMNLGRVVSDIRLEKRYMDKRANFESIGFDFNSQQKRYGYKSIQVAFEKHKDINSDLLVPTKFVVPTGDIIWPVETWGMNLGYVLDCIKRRLPVV
jgi:hypothetical protein